MSQGPSSETARTPVSSATQRMTGGNRKEIGGAELVECDLLVLKCLLTKHKELGPKGGQSCIKDGNGLLYWLGRLLSDTLYGQDTGQLWSGKSSPPSSVPLVPSYWELCGTSWLSWYHNRTGLIRAKGLRENRS